MSQAGRPVCKLCRRAGQKLFLKGQRCLGPKCAFEQRSYPPGQAGRDGSRRRSSDYAKQLREKQKVRCIYRVGEKQFRRYIGRAERMAGISGENLLQLLEQRLDNVIYRAGIASSRAQARQLVGHRHLEVNGRTVTIASYRVAVGDEIAAREKSKDLVPIQEAMQAMAAGAAPQWLAVDSAKRQVRIAALPSRDQIDTDVDEQQVMEFYSR